MKVLKLFLISYPVFVLMDTLWLGVLMRSSYQKQLGTLMKAGQEINWLAALLVWALIVLGALVFVLPKTDGTLVSGLLWGALYGLVLYGVYDLTNLTLIKGWPLMITMIDIAWGMTVSGLLVGFLVWLNARV